MDDKKIELSADIQHELMRRDFWMKVAISTAGKSGSYSDSAPIYANKALEEFDKKFKPLTPSTLKE